MILKRIHLNLGGRLAYTAFLFFLISASQAQEIKKEGVLWFDNIIGITNSGILEGIEYEEAFPGNRTEHKFFAHPNFTKGSVRYKEQSYYDIDLLYDVYGDELLVRHMGINGSKNIQLLKNHVQEFTIEGHRFIHLEFIPNEPVSEPGFYELLLEGKSFRLFEKHKKRILKKTDKETVYYVFSDDHDFYIQHLQTLHRVTSVRDLIKLFPQQKSALQNLGQTHAALRKTNPELYFISICKDLNNSIEKITEKAEL